MGKRSQFERIDRDYYPTFDKRAALVLAPLIRGIETYSEPCYGGGHLVKLLNVHTMATCVQHSDISTGTDALDLQRPQLNGADAIITNPPWSRNVLHDMIMHFSNLAPTWLLFDSDWAYTKQAIPFLMFCTDIAAIGRLKWMEDSNASGKENCSWYRFDAAPSKGIRFHPKPF
jgi:hypothetical protein